MRLRQRPAKNGEILAEYKHHTSVDRSVSGDDTIARNALFVHAKVIATMIDELDRWVGEGGGGGDTGTTGGAQTAQQNKIKRL